MDQNLSNEDKEKQFFDARVKEVEDKIAARFKEIFRKHHQLTPDDIAFLHARQSYLTRAEMEEYKEELAAYEKDLAGEKSFENMNRKELEAILQGLGVQDTSNKVYRTNADLIAAIEELQA